MLRSKLKLKLKNYSFEEIAEIVNKEKDDKIKFNSMADAESQFEKTVQKWLYVVYVLTLLWPLKYCMVTLRGVYEPWPSVIGSMYFVAVGIACFFVLIYVVIITGTYLTRFFLQSP